MTEPVTKPTEDENQRAASVLGPMSSLLEAFFPDRKVTIIVRQEDESAEQAYVASDDDIFPLIRLLTRRVTKEAMRAKNIVGDAAPATKMSADDMLIVNAAKKLQELGDDAMTVLDKAADLALRKKPLGDEVRAALVGIAEHGKHWRPTAPAAEEKKQEATTDGE